MIILFRYMMSRSLELPILGQPRASQRSIAIVSSSIQTRQNQSILLPSSVNQPTLSINSLSNAIPTITPTVITNPQSTGSIEFNKCANLLDVTQQQKANSTPAVNMISTMDGVLQYPAQNSITIVQNNTGSFPATTVFPEQNQILQSNIGIIPQLPTQTIVLPEVGNGTCEQIQYALVATENNEGAYLVPASSILSTGANIQPIEFAKNHESVCPKNLSERGRR